MAEDNSGNVLKLLKGGRSKKKMEKFQNFVMDEIKKWKNGVVTI